MIISTTLASTFGSHVVKLMSPLYRQLLLTEFVSYDDLCFSEYNSDSLLLAWNVNKKDTGEYLNTIAIQDTRKDARMAKLVLDWLGSE